MSKLKTIQEVIEARARERAEKEVKDFISFLDKSDIRDTAVWADTVVIIGEGNRLPLRNVFWSEGNDLPKEIIEELTEKYIPEEVERFVDDVERIKSDVDDL